MKEEDVRIGHILFFFEEMWRYNEHARLFSKIKIIMGEFTIPSADNRYRFERLADEDQIILKSEYKKWLISRNLKEKLNEQN